MNTNSRFRLSFVALLLLFSVPAVADEPATLTESVYIDRATARPAPAGTCTDIRFQITNRSEQYIHLLGLKSDAVSTARLVGRIETDQTTTMESITIPAAETLDLTTTHLSFEVCGLKRPLVLGDEIEVTLDFVDWERTVLVHVHSQ